MVVAQLEGTLLGQIESGWKFFSKDVRQGLKLFFVVHISAHVAAAELA